MVIDINIYFAPAVVRQPFHLFSTNIISFSMSFETRELFAIHISSALKSWFWASSMISALGNRRFIKGES
jgi:hypothetical protein